MVFYIRNRILLGSTTRKKRYSAGAFLMLRLGVMGVGGSLRLGLAGFGFQGISPMLGSMPIL